MGIFGFGGQSKSELKEVIVKKEELITQLRDDKIEAQINLSRAQTGFNAQQESDRANHQVATAQLERRIQVLEADLDDAIEVGVNDRVSELEKEAHQNRVNTRKELRAEFGTELDGLKKSNKTLADESSKHKGLYDGALLVIRAQESHIKELVSLNASLVKALPTVSATITTPNPSVVVGSGNKS